MVFNALCFNRDDHPRNHAFFVEQNRLALTPAYDIVPSAVNIKPLELALRCGKIGRKASIENLLSDVAPFALSVDQAKDTISEMRRVTDDWQEYFAEYGVSEKDVLMLEKRFSL